MNFQNTDGKKVGMAMIQEHEMKDMIASVFIHGKILHTLMRTDGIDQETKEGAYKIYGRLRVTFARLLTMLTGDQNIGPDIMESSMSQGQALIDFLGMEMLADIGGVEPIDGDKSMAYGKMHFGGGGGEPPESA